MANFSVIDPRGDAILICGEAELQVSTKILSLASPVFSALFNPRFAQGQLVPCKPSHIKLPDDDAESMRFMCAVLHHKSTCANATGLERLERLAVLTNKYDCVRAMYYWARCEIFNTKHTKEPSRLLWPAYAFGDAQFFNSITKFMVTHLPNDGKAQTASAKYGIPEGIEKRLPGTLLETIFLTERAIKTEVQIQLEQIISPIASKTPMGDVVPAADDALLSHCDCLSITSFLTGLSRQGLWPLTSAIQRLSISTLCQKLGACDFGLPRRITKMKRCAHCPGDVAGKVARIREFALTAFEGLCLDCVKNAGRSPEQRLPCRVPHQRFRGLQGQVTVSKA